MDAKARRALGAHYTRESNILKLIGPLLLDELRAEFNKVKNNNRKLFDFLKKLSHLSFLDPACGCGNFLVIAYQELRLLELEVLRHVRRSGQLHLSIFQLIQVSVEQFHGIEIEEWPARIAEVALWLTDHQMNLRVSEEFGMYFVRLPLKQAPHIVHGNALQLDWNDVVPAERLDYLLGNPPFVGAKFLHEEQRAEVAAIFHGTKNSGLLDYVACWYRRAAEYMAGSLSSLEPGFESNSLPSPAGRGVGGEGLRSKYPLPRQYLAFARTLRAGQTDAENLLWGLLRDRRLGGAKFRRQHPFPPYILDLYCHEAKLVVELDGGQHLESESDRTRDAFLTKQGLRVLRFWNNEVLAETEAVLESIWNALVQSGVVAGDEGRPSPPPLSRGERGEIRAAFVSTNSITQGEQVGVLWPDLFRLGVKIHFAHRTFQWSSEARGKAAVHCVIVGFGLQDVPVKWLFDYETPKSEPHAIKAANINPYLVDGPSVVLANRSQPICAVPRIGIGNKPIDGGNYLFTTEERDAFLAREPSAAPWFRRWIGADEFLNGYERWCLWLGDCPPEELRRMPEALQRVEAVRDFRLASKSAPTRKLAETPTRFHVENMPLDTYLVIPEVSSERRLYIPIGFEQPSTLASNLIKVVPHAALYHFGVLHSLMHNAWMRAVCGRLKSDYRYSAGIVYNNFPWPEPSDRQHRAIEEAAQAVLTARARHPQATLADLYDPLTMPQDLGKAHQALDRTVDQAYGRKTFAAEAERVAFLFQRYQQLLVG
jgi:very-short-patch-repair endonuclease